MKILVMFSLFLALLVNLWGCSSKGKKVTEIASKDTTTLQSLPSEILDPPSSSVKADEYTEKQIREENSYDNSDFTFAGSLRKKNGDEILITMYLKAQNGILQGKYFYEANPDKEDISLKGHIMGDSLMLLEYDAQSNITGRFNGRIIGNDTFEGVWSIPNNKRSLFFKLFFDDMAYEQRKIIGLKADDYAEYTGDEQNH